MTHPLPRLSIILPAYNAETYIALTIQSILDQDYHDYELLIIDDGSTDNTEATIKHFIDPRITYIKNPQNIGLIATLNKGLSLAHGYYIGRIDADDVWHDQKKISTQIEFLDSHPETVLLGTSAIAIDEYGKKLFDMQYPTGNSYIKSIFLKGNPFIHPSVIFRKDIALKAGGFNQADLYVEDYSLWLRMGKYGDVDNLPEKMMQYRIHHGGVSQKNAKVQVNQSLLITKPFRHIYGGYIRGRIKWYIKLLLLQIKGITLINGIKNTIRKSS